VVEVSLVVTEPDSPEVLERFHQELALVEIIARQVSRSVGSRVEFDDLLSAGREGLLDAARRFDASRNVPFRAYANFRVRGAIMDGVRSLASLSRRAHERLAALEAAARITEGVADHVFEPAEVADEGDAEAEDALDQQLAMMAVASAVGLAAEIARGQAEAAESSNPEEALSQAEILAHLHRELGELDGDRHVTIIRLFYFEGKSMGAIATELDMNKSTVSRLHADAIAQLAKRLRKFS
jgi:RNA polymerase sigma factor for flagellar operon FliA